MSVKQSKKKDAVKVSHAFLLECAANKNLSKKAYRVLLYLLTVSSSEVMTQIKQKDISGELDMDKSSVSLAIRELVDEEIVSYITMMQLCRFNEVDEDYD